jgi:hypothetical protein
MNFIKHVLTREGVRPNPKKLYPIKDWKRLFTTKGILSFLGLANFYQKFIRNFLHMEKPLSTLLIKDYLLNGKGSNKGQYKTCKKNFHLPLC